MLLQSKYFPLIQKMSITCIYIVCRKGSTKTYRWDGKSCVPKLL